MIPRGFYARLGLLCAAALTIRVAYVLLLEHPLELVGDEYQYHHGANLLVEGRGFIGAHAFIGAGEVVQTAQHPPLYTIALAIPSVAGLDSVLSHQLWSTVIGTATVAMLGILGLRLAGPRVGLIAAAMGALYPNLWINDGLVMAETLSALITAVVLLAAYRLWNAPSARAAAWLGIACALAALARSEGLLLLPLITAPWIVLASEPAVLVRRIRLGLMTVLAAGVALAPWVGHNLWRFDSPVFTSTGLDLALIQGNCEPSYFGDEIGYYTLSCIPRGVPGGATDQPGTGDQSQAPGNGDEAEIYRSYRREALGFVRENLGRVPFVMFARVGRTWGFYRPVQQINFDSFVENRNVQVARAGLASYYVLVVGAIGGTVVLRRRRVAISPLMATMVTVTAAVVVAWGSTRYRVSAEPALVVLTAVAVDALLRRQSTPASEVTSATAAASAER